MGALSGLVMSCPFGMSNVGPRRRFLATLMEIIGTGKEPWVCISRRTAGGWFR
jgi:hypothetical protein